MWSTQSEVTLLSKSRNRLGMKLKMVKYGLWQKTRVSLNLCVLRLNPFLHLYSFKKKALGKTLWKKGEIAQNEQFHLFLQCFPCNLYLKIL